MLGGAYVKNSNITIPWKTTLCNKYNCASGNEEYVTNFNDTGWTSGGGFSNYSNRDVEANWQSFAVDEYLNSGAPLPAYFNRNGRAYPDVSVVGHSCPVVMDKKVFPVDGTSCSAPIFASIISKINTYQILRDKPKLGFFKPTIISNVF